MRHKNSTLNEVVTLKNDISFLVVTATEIETNELHSRMNSKNDLPILRIFEGKQTYYIGYLGLYLIVHVECRMGAISDQASIITTTNAINLWNPVGVIMPGIAFGVDEEKQKIGEVLISESVIPYNVCRVGKTENIFRAPIPPAGGVLLNRFKHLSREWKHADGNEFKIHFTSMLSGESLVDNIDYRNLLLSKFPESKGGEMEGAGIFAAANDKNLEWLLVKSICDFGDGKKNENKAKNQALAAKTSLDLCEHVFGSKNVFAELTKKEFPIESQSYLLNQKGVVNINDVLFDVYEKSNERFYLIRELDKYILGQTDIYSIWLYGKSGNGKTSIIQRYLKYFDKKAVCISLGSCIGYDALKLMNYILLELEENRGVDLLEIPKFDAPIIVKKIYNSIKSYIGLETEGYIYIDELPIEDSEQFKVFTGLLLGILQYAALKNEGFQIKVMISTIRNVTKEDLSDSLKNVSEKVKFIEVDKWSIEELGSLLKIYVDELKLNIAQHQVEKIISIANGSPRFVKQFVKNILAMNCKGFDSILEQTQREIL